MKRLWLTVGLVVVALIAACLAPSILSTIARSLVGTVPVGDGAPLADPTRALLYVVSGYGDTIHAVDHNSNVIVHSFPLSHDVSASASDPVADRLYAALGRPIHVLDAATGPQAGTFGERAFDPEESVAGPRPHHPVEMYLPIIRKRFPLPTPTPTPTITPTPTPTPEWQGRPNDGLWQGQTITDGHSDKPQTVSFETASGGSKIRAGMDLVTYVYESNFWICYGTATWEIASAVPIGTDGTFTFSRGYINGSISGTGRFISPARAEGTYSTRVLYGVCGNIYNTGAWWAEWQGAATSEISGLTAEGELRLEMWTE